MDKKDLYNKIRYLIQNRVSFSELCKELNLNDYELLYIIECMNEYGIPITIKDNEFVKNEKSKVIEEPFNIDINKSHIKIGFIGDTHLSSVYDDVDTLRRVYEVAEEKNTDLILHAGDVTEGVLGIQNFQRHLKEDTYFGQLKYVVDKYPKYSGKTYAISGNHDDYFTMLSGKEIIGDISKERKDIIYLGRKRRIHINGLKIDILHGDVDLSTNSGFRPTRYLRNIPKEDRPHILHCGHKHVSNYGEYEDTKIIRAGCFVGTSVNCKKKICNPKNDESVYFADIYFDDNGLPEDFTFKKLSLSK